jgi:hypothetical protein
MPINSRFSIQREAYLDFLATIIDGWFFTPEAKAVAREALEEVKATSCGKGR